MLGESARAAESDRHPPRANLGNHNDKGGGPGIGTAP